MRFLGLSWSGGSYKRGVLGAKTKADILKRSDFLALRDEPQLWHFLTMRIEHRKTQIVVITLARVLTANWRSAIGNYGPLFPLRVSW